MKEIIIVTKVDDVHVKVDCDVGIGHELHDYFSFEADGYRFHPKFKARVWDGKIHLFSPYKKQLYLGLVPHLLDFANKNDYEVVLDPLLDNEPVITPEDLVEFVKWLNVHSDGEKIHARDYQYMAIFNAINDKRVTLLSPTASGKSFIIYCIIRWYQEYYKQNHKILLIVPTIGLTTQMKSDFADYSSEVAWDADKNVHLISGGAEKHTDANIVISTWQSIYEMPKKWFDQFRIIIGDEAHTFAAKSLQGVMSKLTFCPYKIGTTGTIGSKKVNKLVLEGLFGPVKKVITTKELMDRGQVAQLLIKAVSLNYNDEDRKAVAKTDYPKEIDWLIASKKRGRAVMELVAEQEGNSIVLFGRKKHGNEMYKYMEKHHPERKVFLIHGDVDKAEREEVRKIVDKEKNAIIIASYGTFSTGINIKNIHHVFFAAPSKSMIRVLQSIGRALRKSKTKDSAILWDIVDDLKHRKRKNYALKHFLERIGIYNEEQFKYELSKIDLS